MSRIPALRSLLLVPAVLMCLSGCGEDSTSDPVQIAALCRELHAPDPAYTARCQRRTTLTLSQIKQECQIHLRAGPGSDLRAYQSCLGRVTQRMPTWIDKALARYNIK